MADSWPANGPPLLWARDIGAGYSGLIAKDGRVYTQTQGLTEQKVVALDADTGQTLWEHGYERPYQLGGMFPGPRATPTLSNQRIYFASPNGLIGCLDAANGQPLWSINVIQKFDGHGAGFGYACSPVVEEGMVILPVGGPAASMVALDAATGAIRWTSGTAPASYCSALPITFQGHRHVVVFLQNTLAGFDLLTGRLLWERSYPRGYEEHAAAILYEEPYLRAFQAYQAGSELFMLQAAPSQNIDGVPGCAIKRIRQDPRMSNDVASSVLVDGFVYGFDLREMQAAGGRPSRGTFRCMDFKTGVVRWSSDQPGQASIVVADRKMLMLNDRGQLLLVRANPHRYEELARTEIFPGETCWTAPALDHGRLYLRSPTRAVCVFVGKPERMTARQRALASSAGTIAKTTSTNLTWLVGAEREGPFEMPELHELARWYLFSLIAFAVAVLPAGIVYKISHRAALVVFFLALSVFGIIATPLFNRFCTPFIFTWPLSLITAHQIALAAVSWAKQPSRVRSFDWIGIAGAAFLILACLVYFKLTRQLNLAPGWYFLALLPASWPLAVPAARQLSRSRNLAAHVLWMFAVFSIYFWVSGGVMVLRNVYR